MKKILEPILVISLGFVLMFSLASCGGSSSGGSGLSAGAETYSGSFAGAGGETGTISLTTSTSTTALMLAETLTITGTLTLGSGTVSLSGTVNTDTGVFSVEGGGYKFTGTADGDEMSGTYTGPGGAGSFSGFDTSSGITLTILCGTVSVANSIIGVWNIIIASNNQLSGAVFIFADAAAFDIDGSLSDSTITISPDSEDGLVSASGTLSGTGSAATASGVFEDDDGLTGTWSGSVAACP